jgi:RNA recognition motif-containing protein
MNKLPSTLFIGDLSIFCTIQDIEKVFSTFGPIVDIRIKRDENTNKNLSYGFVKYVLVNSAEQALNNLNGFVLCGRPMR